MRNREKELKMRWGGCGDHLIGGDGGVLVVHQQEGRKRNERKKGKEKETERERVSEMDVGDYSMLAARSERGNKEKDTERGRKWGKLGKKERNREGENRERNREIERDGAGCRFAGDGDGQQ